MEPAGPAAPRLARGVNADPFRQAANASAI